MTDALTRDNDPVAHIAALSVAKEPAPQAFAHKPTLHLPPQTADSRLVARHPKVRKAIASALESDSVVLHSFA